jgi:hypothetical protein
VYRFFIRGILVE